MRAKLTTLNRRDFIRISVANALATALAACGIRPSESSALVPPQSAGTPQSTLAPEITATEVETAQSLPPTPSCGDDDDPTPEQTSGPFFTPNSPERRSLLEPGLPGIPLIVSGQVLTRTCEPVANALLDFWQADEAGNYDNEGFRLRGHQFANAEGRYQLETVMPGLYPGRTRHIHVRVQAPNGPILTTQLYFPGEPANGRDGIYQPELLIQVQQAGKATFSFVLGGV